MKLKVLLIALVISSYVSAQDFKVSINKLTEETQQLSESADNMKMIWWIPTDFWKAVFAEDQTISKDQADEIITVFDQYTVLAVLDGKIGTFGDVTYKPKDDIFNALEILDNDKQKYGPLLESEIDEKSKAILAIMKPMLGNMLGNMGSNMHFFLFQKKHDPLSRIVDPKKEGTFAVNLSGENFTWKLPLSSLLKPKKCPVDGALLNGTWKYCPFHGEELIKQ